MLLGRGFYVISVKRFGVGKGFNGNHGFSANGIIDGIIIIVFKQVISGEHSLTRFIV